ncbi:MAG: hypothetical protein QHC90_14560 [Shinella sp.]|nr:hypothetical protein [Shinella sp.]
MNTTSEPQSKITVSQLPNGRWCFVLTFRGVTYPAQGSFPSLMAADAAAKATIRALENRR